MRPYFGIFSWLFAPKPSHKPGEKASHSGIFTKIDANGHKLKGEATFVKGKTVPPGYPGGKWEAAKLTNHKKK